MKRSNRLTRCRRTDNGHGDQKRTTQTATKEASRITSIDNLPAQEAIRNQSHDGGAESGHNGAS